MKVEQEATSGFPLPGVIFTRWSGYGDTFENGQCEAVNQSKQSRAIALPPENQLRYPQYLNVGHSVQLPLPGTNQSEDGVHSRMLWK